MPFSTDISKAFLELYFGSKNSLTYATDTYLALCTNDPETDNGEFNELSEDDGYKRVWFTTKTANAKWPDYMSAAGEQPDSSLPNFDPNDETYLRGIHNKNEIHFNKATSDWPTVHGFGVYNTKEVGTGTLIYYAKLDNPEGITVPTNGVALFDPNTLRISFAATDVTE